MRDSFTRVRRQGFALVLVLIVLSFAAVITLMFLLSARQERSGTSAYAQGSAVRELGSQAVGIVIGQINAATHEGTMATPVSWASQPGMIRTYNTQGKLSNAYKLYSWNSMTEAGTAFSPTATSELPDANWASEPAAFTDINQPVNQIYPIVDPNVLDVVNGTTTTTNHDTIPWDFPGEAGLVTSAAGYYASSNNTVPMPVQWLYILQDGTWCSPTNITGNMVTVANATATNPIVGRIAFWTDDETSKVNLNTAGEGAYWDTPKAGTADELQFAGNPPLQSEFHRISGHPATTSLSAVFPEILGGTTASASRWTSSGAINSSYVTALESLFGYGAANSATSHGLSPRLSWGASQTSAGSQGGTYPITSYLATYEPPVPTSGFVTPSSYLPVPNIDRLYATPDDAYFQPGQQSATGRSQNVALANYGITPQKLQRRLFFVTSESQAPETTLFETPRISMWPITWPYAKSSYWASDSFNRGTSPGTLTPSPANLSANFSTYKDMTYQENLLAFSSTLNASNSNTSVIYPYYFQRQDPDSPTWDWSNITRNQNLVSYLASELSDPKSTSPYPTAPGIGASLGAKWDADKSGTTDWISLNCFDYIRSMINQYTLDPNSSTGLLLYSYTGVNLGSATHLQEQNSFTAVPLTASLNGSSYVTEGTFPALREAALVFYATARNTPRFVSPSGSTTGPFKLSEVTNPDNWNNLISWNGTTGKSQTTQMRMVMLLNFSQMNPGIQAGSYYNNLYKPVFWVKVSTPSGSSQFQVNGNSINFPLSGGNVVEFNPITTTTYNNTTPGYAQALFQSKTAAKTFTNTAGGSATNWSLISDPITINPTTNPYSFTFTGSKVQIDVYSIPSGTESGSGSITTDPTSNSANLVSTQIVDFSKWNSTTAFGNNGNTGMAAGQFPLPIAPYWNVRQGPMVPSPLPTSGAGVVTAANIASLLANPATTVTGGVLMPWFSNNGTAGNNPNWQSEIVPRIAQMSGLQTSGGVLAQWGVKRVDNPTPSLDPSDTTNLESLMYAYQGSSTSSTYTSTDFSQRVNALPYSTSTTPALKGLALDSPSYTGITVSPPSAYPQVLFGGTERTMGLAGYQLITPYDTVISMVVDPTADTRQGDPRLVGHGIAPGSATFSPIDQICSSSSSVDNQPANPISPLSTTVTGATPSLAKFGQTGFLLTAGAQYHELGSPSPVPQITGIHPAWLFGGAQIGTRGAATLGTGTPSATLTGAAPFQSNTLMLGDNDPQFGIGVESNALMTLNPNWDFTRLPGNFADGGYLFRPDQEYQALYPNPNRTASIFSVPFFESLDPVSGSTTVNINAGFFSPNRQVPSPIILGTLPDSMTTGWQTLNFCPNPAITMNSGTAHPGMGAANSPTATGSAYSTAPDHLLLDLFWMPVAEPYPISQQFATAGKVNLNYAMMPFPYIQRKTALDALLKSVWITAMPSPNATANTANFAAYYKSYGMLYQNNRLDLAHTRYPVNVSATLNAFDYKFQQGDIFRSASQICDMFLYPNDPNTPNTLWAGDSNTKGITAADTPPSTSNIKTWWAANSFTADNDRESPYNAIYSRVTTKSNTFKVHWRVQTLKKTSASPTTWTEGTDLTTAELRGSSLIERFIDPNATLPDYATLTPARTGEAIQPMSYYYKWRVDSENYFQPSP